MVLEFNYIVIRDRIQIHTYIVDGGDVGGVREGVLGRDVVIFVFLVVIIGVVCGLNGGIDGGNTVGSFCCSR